MVNIDGNGNRNNNNPDDYRFSKDPYVVKDMTTTKLSQSLGTPSHVEFLRMSEGDKKRHKSRCIEYDKKKDVCICTKSPLFMMRCSGSSHCHYYKEE